MIPNKTRTNNVRQRLNKATIKTVATTKTPMMSIRVTYNRKLPVYKTKKYRTTFNPSAPNQAIIGIFAWRFHK